MNTSGAVTLGLAVLLLGPTSAAFFIKWPWQFLYPGLTPTTTTTALGAASINYGFLSPALIIQRPTTTTLATTAATTTTTTTTTTARPTTPLNQLLLNALLAGLPATFPIPTNNSAFLISLAGALGAAGNRPIIGGVAQPFPSQVGGIPPIVGGVASPIGGGGLISPFPGGGIAVPNPGGGLALPISGVSGSLSGGLVLPNGFPSGGGVIGGGVLPGFFPGGILGKSAGTGGSGLKTTSARNSGKIIFAASKKK